MERRVDAMPDKPGKGFFGWLGRQVGYVSKALKADAAAPKTVYRQEKVEERPLPEDPGVVLRRTTTDEVIVNKEAARARPARDG